MKGASKRVAGGTRKAFTITPKDLYGTPDDFYAGLDAVFHFNLDAAADKDNAKCFEYINAEMDALKQPWSLLTGQVSHVFCNPPYSAGWKDAFCARAIEQVTKQIAAFVVMLLPANTADGFWMRYVWPHAAEILHVQGRLAFKRPGQPPVGADFPSATVIFRPHLAGPAVGMIDRHGRRVKP